MVFCNDKEIKTYDLLKTVTILILIDGFLQYKACSEWDRLPKVTILILIDGFLQLLTPLGMVHHKVKSQSLF